jgi:secreted trypsin-like serine protease
MRIRSTLFLCALVALLAAPSPAGAIVGGTPDNGAHPYVAAISNGSTICSGVAISPTVLVTSAHCFAFPAQPVRAIFDESFRSPTRVLVPGVWYAHPGFCPSCENGRLEQASRDVAVVILSRPVSLPRYASLPASGFVAALPDHTDVELVGYGVQEFTDGGGKPTALPASGLRMRGSAELVGVGLGSEDELARVTALRGGGRAASCFGDSGGPVLVGDTILAINSFGSNRFCRGVTYAYRLDTPVALDFISGAL